jgi:hypothetical protein
MLTNNILIAATTAATLYFIFWGMVIAPFVTIASIATGLVIYNLAERGL